MTSDNDIMLYHLKHDTKWRGVHLPWLVSGRLSPARWTPSYESQYVASYNKISKYVTKGLTESNNKLNAVIAEKKRILNRLIEAYEKRLDIPDSGGILKSLTTEEVNELIYESHEPNKILDSEADVRRDRDKFNFYARYALPFISEVTGWQLDKYRKVLEFRLTRLYVEYNEAQLSILNRRQDEIEKPSPAFEKLKNRETEPIRKIKSKKLKEYRWNYADQEHILGWLCWSCSYESKFPPPSKVCPSCKNPLVIIKELGAS